MKLRRSRDSTQKRAFGNLLEGHAADYLQARGLRLIQRNFQCKLGEIDLIMSAQGTLVFVEVRFRRSTRFGSAIESVGPQKQRKIKLCASYFLLRQQQLADCPCRFDVIGIEPRRAMDATGTDISAADLHFHWIQNAFQ